jgi:hypothetical protein
MVLPTPSPRSRNKSEVEASIHAFGRAMS